MHPTPPVLFVVFNRPDLAEKTFEAIRAAKPAQFFIAADGPRSTHEDDARLCEECRAIVDRVDWACEVKTLFREENLGCRSSMSSAITWFFEHVESGIILEDDCLPEASFFPFCAKLLERYRDDERVFSVSGDNGYLTETAYEPNSSYIFTVIPGIWGWATWRRAWQHYDLEMTTWDNKASASEAMSAFERTHDAAYWSHEFDKAYQGKLDTWDYAWFLTCLNREAVHAIPYNNMTSNIGFDDRGTHTTDSDSKESMRPVEPIKFPLKHPEEVSRVKEAELLMLDARWDTKAWYENERINKSFSRRVYRKIKRILQTACALVCCRAFGLDQALYDLSYCVLG